MSLLSVAELHKVRIRHSCADVVVDEGETFAVSLSYWRLVNGLLWLGVHLRRRRDWGSWPMNMLNLWLRRWLCFDSDRFWELSSSFDICLDNFSLNWADVHLLNRSPFVAFRYLPFYNLFNNLIRPLAPIKPGNYFRSVAPQTHSH